CFSSARRNTRSKRDWSSDVCSSDLPLPIKAPIVPPIKIAGTRFLIPLFFGVATAILIGGTIGALIGNGFIHTILMVVLPLMGGGCGRATCTEDGQIASQQRQVAAYK